MGSGSSVVNDAAHSGAARSMAQPFDDLASNALPQLEVLEALKSYNPGARVIFPGSRLQYGRPRTVPVTEDHPQDPTSIYGLHKMLAERSNYAIHLGLTEAGMGSKGIVASAQSPPAA